MDRLVLKPIFLAMMTRSDVTGQILQASGRKEFEPETVEQLRHILALRRQFGPPAKYRKFEPSKIKK